MVYPAKRGSPQSFRDDTILYGLGVVDLAEEVVRELVSDGIRGFVFLAFFLCRFLEMSFFDFIEGI